MSLNSLTFFLELYTKLNPP